MVNLEKLVKSIEDSGITMSALARKTGIKRETLYNRLNNSAEFKASEMMKLAEALGLSKEECCEIFFAD